MVSATCFVDESPVFIPELQILQESRMSFELITANQHPNMDYRIANTNYGL